MKRKIPYVILIFVILIISSVCYVNAASGSFNPDDWKPDSTTEATGAGRLQNMGNVIIGALRTVGSIVSVAVLAVLGIKYMVGSVEERATYKETMKPYLIGAVLVFAITNILGIIVNVATSLID